MPVATRSRGGAIVSGASCTIFRDGPGRYRTLFGAVEANGGVVPQILRFEAGCARASGGPASYPWYDSSLSSSTSEAEPSMKARARKGTGPRAVGGCVDAGGSHGEPAS